jgi:Flp pilus assembly protein TadG
MFWSRFTGAERRRLRTQEERGAAAVEFALVLPVLLLVVFGIISFGFLMAQKASLSNATRAGARYGTVNAYSASTRTCASVIDKVRATAPTVGIPDTANGRKAVGVTVTLTSGATSATVPGVGCAAAKNDATVTGAGASLLPCQNTLNGSPATPDTLTITTTYDSKFLVPIPGVGTTFALGGSSTFQCEYYK